MNAIGLAFCRAYKGDAGILSSKMWETEMVTNHQAAAQKLGDHREHNTAKKQRDDGGIAPSV
jgi:hypothetical protein